MTKEEWVNLLHQETRNNPTFAYYWAIRAAYLTVTSSEAMVFASPAFQLATKERTKTWKANQRKLTKAQIMRDMGLVAVMGSVSGKIYWE